MFYLSFSLVLCSLGIVGCESERNYNNDTYSSNAYEYPRYISVDIFSYTSWLMDIYIGDAYVGSIAPGQTETFSKDLYHREKFRMKFVVYNPTKTTILLMSFDDDYSNYHVNVYDNFVEKF